MTEKVITSKDTSVNKEKVPKIFGKLKREGVYRMHLFDVGCGKWTDHIKEYTENNGICLHYHGFDKYNQPEWRNKITIHIAETERTTNPDNPNVFVSSNVLNVIKGEGKQREYLQGIFEMMKDIDECYITVYEGNRSGIGRVTKKDCWQENKKLKEYLEIVKTAYRDTHIFSCMNGIARHCIDIKYGMIRVYPACGK